MVSDASDEGFMSRNDFAHNFRVLTEEQCKTVIYRINKTYIEFKEVIQVYYNFR